MDTHKDETLKLLKDRPPMYRIVRTNSYGKEPEEVIKTEWKCKEETIMDFYLIISDVVNELMFKKCWFSMDQTYKNRIYFTIVTETKMSTVIFEIEERNFETKQSDLEAQLKETIINGLSGFQDWPTITTVMEEYND